MKENPQPSQYLPAINIPVCRSVSPNVVISMAVALCRPHTQVILYERYKV